MKTIKTCIIALICSSLSISNGIAQPKALLLNKVAFKDIPNQISVPANTVSSYKWKDKEGENYLILTNLKKDTSIDHAIFGGRWKTGYIEVFHYVKKGENIKLLTYIKDNAKACDGSYLNGFITNSITLTDLNANGIGEITLQYNYACRSDIIPPYKTLLFFENGIVSSLYGIMMNNILKGKIKTEMNWDRVPESEKKEIYNFGYYQNEENIRHNSEQILKHIRKQWNLHIFESK
jgi:hypothetical protein